MEVAGAEYDRLRRATPDAQAAETASHDVHHLLFPLEAAFHCEERRMLHDLAIVVVQLTRHDDVHVAELILQQHEYRALRRRRMLPRDDEPRHDNALTSRIVLQI